MVNSVVSAELPPSPDASDDPAVKAQRQRLQEIVLSNMIHGPCGKDNPISLQVQNTSTSTLQKDLIEPWYLQKFKMKLGMR